MRFGLALLSLCSSTSNKRFSRSLAIVQRGHIDSFMQSTHFKRFRSDETSQFTKRRMVDIRQDGTSQDGNDHINSDIAGNFGLYRRRSPYERKIGKIIQLCPKCNGESKIRSNLSKKARARRKEAMQQTGDKAIPPIISMKPCNECDASGLVAISASHVNSYDGGDGASSPSGTSVAIVGGGIGGVALAAALQQRKIPCKIYERDLSFEERKQGYGLTMQQGARALRALGFFSLIDVDEDESEQHANQAEQELDAKPSSFGIHSTRHVVHKPDGTIVGEWGLKVWGGRFEKNGKKHAKRQNAHISRQNLRSMLMEMLRPGTMQWGYQFVGYSRVNEEECRPEDNESNKFNTLKLTFRQRRSNSDCKDEQEITANASILVGCDGLRSFVRAKKLGSDIAPLRYLGCIVILGISVSPPHSNLTDGETVFQTADGTTRLYANQGWVRVLCS